MQIVLLQFDPQSRSATENISYILEHVKNHKDSLVVLPELFLSSYYDYTYIPAKSLGKTLKPLRVLCKKNNLAFVGSLPIETAQGRFNRGLFITAERLFKKDKSKLFGNELKTMKAGRRNPLFPYQDTFFSLQVCYDIVDPVSAHKATKKGARFLINPATVSVDFLLTINKARALENNIVSIFCNPCGKEENGIQYLGNSGVFFPDGTQKTLTNKKGLLTIRV